MSTEVCKDLSASTAQSWHIPRPPSPGGQPRKACLCLLQNPLLKGPLHKGLTGAPAGSDGSQPPRQDIGSLSCSGPCLPFHPHLLKPMPSSASASALLAASGSLSRRDLPAPVCFPIRLLLRALFTKTWSPHVTLSFKFWLSLHLERGTHHAC